jgi:hypothetical protein
MFESAIWRALYASAASRRMRADASYGGWSDGLKELADSLGAGEVRGALSRIALGQRLDSEVDRFMLEVAASVSYEECRSGARAATALAPSSPHASWVLALLVLGAWDTALGDGVAEPPALGSQHLEAWTTLPYTCATTGRAVGAIGSAKACLAPVRSMLAVASRKFGMTDDLRWQTLRHDKLSRDIARLWSILVRDGAEDMRAGLERDPKRHRPLVASIYFALGYVPEGETVRLSKTLPTRAMLERLIRECLPRIERDRVLRELWANVGESGLLSYGNHEELMAALTAKYPQPRDVWTTIDELLPPEAISQVLVRYYSGQLTHHDARRFMEACAPVFSVPDLAGRPYELVRIMSLAALIREDYCRWASALPRSEGWINTKQGPDEGPLGVLTSWAFVVDQALQFGRVDARRVPTPRGLDAPFFLFIDAQLRSLSGDRAAAAAQIFDRLEVFRAMPHRPYMDIHRRLQPNNTSEAGMELLSARKTCIGRLHTAFLLGQLPRLPLHVTLELLQGPNRDTRENRERIRRYRELAEDVASELIEELDFIDESLDDMSGFQRAGDGSGALERLVWALGRHSAQPPPETGL